MSFVVAAIMKDMVYVVGDTQLNDNNGVINAIGIKVLPVGNNTLLGVTGKYQTTMELSSEVEKVKDKCFDEKLFFIQNFLKNRNVDNNIVLAGIENGCGKYISLSKKTGFNGRIENVHDNIEIVTLLPPEASDVFCRKYINSLHKIKEQLLTCVEEVSKISNSVNNRIFGIQTDGLKTDAFTKNISYNDIDFRIQ